MYARDTVLARREPFVAPNPKADPPVEGDARYIYNRVRVIGPSPVAHLGGQVAEWQSGPGSQGVVLEPLDGFGGNVDRPLGEIQQLYTIEREPEQVFVEQKIRVINAATREAGPTPEEVFAEVAAVSSTPAADKPGGRRTRK